MKLIDRYEFTNGKKYETYHLELEDARKLNVPECDVLGLLSIGGDNSDGEVRMSVMRPDEALIQARMLIDAVNKVTEGYSVNKPKTYVGYEPATPNYPRQRHETPLSTELVDDLQEMDHAAIEERRESETRNAEDIREEKR